jgi:hypothetical protein
MRDADLEAILLDPEPTTWIATALDADVAGAPTRDRAIADELDRLGASEQDRQAVVDALSTVTGVAAPAMRHIIVQRGAVVLDQVFPGEPSQPDAVGWGRVPDLVPLLRDRAKVVDYLVVEADREGGEIRSYRAGATGPTTNDRVEGRADHLHKVPSGGWSNLNYQEHTEEIWKQNQKELAAHVDDLVREGSPRFVLLAGDVRATELLEKQLSPAARELVRAVGAHTGAPGASDDALQQQLHEAIDEASRSERARIADDIQTDHRDKGARGLGAVVEALRQAQVAVLLLAPARASERRALALDGSPWIATAPEDTLGAAVIGEVPAPAALVRAALLTDADILFDDDDAPLDPSGISAALRWHTGPAVPGD